MSRLLEILGRGLEVDTAGLIKDWLYTVVNKENSGGPEIWRQVDETDRAGQAETIAQRDFREIVDLIAAGKTGPAEEKLRFFLFEDPGSVEGRMAAAAISLGRDDVEGAVESLRSVYMRQPGNTMGLYALGHCCERLGREAEAVEYYQDCLKYGRELELPQYRLAAIYFKQGRLGDTTAEYERICTEKPGDITSLVTLGHLYLAGRRWQEAIEAFNNAILMHPDNFRAEQGEQEADYVVQQGAAEESVRWFEAAVKDNDEDAEAHMRLAELLGAVGDDTEAVAHYKRALEIEPNSLVGVIKLATHHLRNRRGHAAAEEFTRAVEINEQVVEAYQGLARAQSLAGDAKEAVNTVSLGAAIHQNSILLFTHAAILQVESESGGELAGSGKGIAELAAKAIGAHEKRLAESPANPEVLHRYALLLAGAGRGADAVRALEAALRINPAYHRARCTLVALLCEGVSAESALAYLVGERPPGRDVVDLHYRTAILYCNKSRFVGALGQVQSSLQKNLADLDPTSNLSVVLQNLGLLDRAALAWQCLCDTTDRAGRESTGGQAPNSG